MTDTKPKGEVTGVKGHGHHFAVSSSTGVHIGLWQDGKIAHDVLREYPGGTLAELVDFDLIAETKAERDQLATQVLALREALKELSAQVGADHVKFETDAYYVRQAMVAADKALTSTETTANTIAAKIRADTFQSRVSPWMQECFGAEIAADVTERNHRFLEEALELVQSNGCTADEAHQLVDYVFGREVGEPSQEVGGVMVTHAALCLAIGINMHEAGEIELQRVWQNIEKIRAKQAAKPEFSPLPGSYDGARSLSNKEGE